LSLLNQNLSGSVLLLTFWPAVEDDDKKVRVMLREPFDSQVFQSSFLLYIKVPSGPFYISLTNQGHGPYCKLGTKFFSPLIYGPSVKCTSRKWNGKNKDL